MRALAAIVALILVVPAWVKAVEGRVPAVEVTVSYEEPRVNANGSGIRDLQKTTVYWHWKGKPGRVVKAVDVPASRPTGGGKVRVTLVIPLTDRREREVTVYTTASDRSGHESRKSNEATIRVDKLRRVPDGRTKARHS